MMYIVGCQKIVAVLGHPPSKVSLKEPRNPYHIEPAFKGGVCPLRILQEGSPSPRNWVSKGKEQSRAWVAKSNGK